MAGYEKTEGTWVLDHLNLALTCWSVNSTLQLHYYRSFNNSQLQFLRYSLSNYVLNAVTYMTLCHPSSNPMIWYFLHFFGWRNQMQLQIHYMTKAYGHSKYLTFPMQYMPTKVYAFQNVNHSHIMRHKPLHSLLLTPLVKPCQPMIRFQFLWVNSLSRTLLQLTDEKPYLQQSTSSKVSGVVLLVPECQLDHKRQKKLSLSLLQQPT